MKRIMTSKKLFLLCILALLLLSFAGCGEDEELPELGCTVDVLIDKDNFNDWEVGIPLRSPEYRTQLVAWPFYEATLLLAEDGVALGEKMPRVESDRSDENRDWRKEAWDLLKAVEDASEYVEQCEKEQWFDDLFCEERYAVAYHFDESRWTNDDEGNITGAKGVFLIYDMDIKEIEYLAFIEYTMNYVSDYRNTIFMLEQADETAE